jgi:hypothetical protein
MVKVLRNYLPAISERGDQWIRNIQFWLYDVCYLFSLHQPCKTHHKVVNKGIYSPPKYACH